MALGTQRGGVVLIDDTGRLLRVLNEASGLRNETVRFTYVNRQGGLWLALNNGLARVEAAAPLSYYDKTMGLGGIVIEIARHQGRLYVATTLGVYVLEPAADGAVPRFRRHPETQQECWSLLSTPQGLLAGCTGGLYNLDEHQLIWPYAGPVYEVVRSSRDETLIYLGLKAGLARMRLRAGQWTDGERIDGFEKEARSLAEDAQGRLWIAQKDGVARLEATASPAGGVLGQDRAEAAVDGHEARGASRPLPGRGSPAGAFGRLEHGGALRREEPDPTGHLVHMDPPAGQAVGLEPAEDRVAGDLMPWLNSASEWVWMKTSSWPQ